MIKNRDVRSETEDSHDRRSTLVGISRLPSFDYKLFATWINNNELRRGKFASSQKLNIIFAIVFWIISRCKPGLIQCQ